jgi:hypothetical protein
VLFCKSFREREVKVFCFETRVSSLVTAAMFSQHNLLQFLFLLPVGLNYKFSRLIRPVCLVFYAMILVTNDKKDKTVTLSGMLMINNHPIPNHLETV